VFAQGVRDFVREHGATFLVARDPADNVRHLYQSIGVPESYLVGADGRLLWRQIGAFPAGAAAAREAIEQALAAPYPDPVAHPATEYAA
jgi:hypothetical protein